MDLAGQGEMPGSKLELSQSSQPVSQLGGCRQLYLGEIYIKYKTIFTYHYISPR